MANPDALRLQILLLLGENKPHVAQKYIVPYIQLKPDPYFIYYLGYYFYQNRKFDAALIHFERAIELSLQNFSRIDPKGSDKIENIFYKNNTILLCHWEVAKKTFGIKDRIPNDFSNPQRANQHWRKQFSLDEVRWAAFHARIWRKKFHAGSKESKTGQTSQSIPSDKQILEKIGPDFERTAALDKASEKLLRNTSLDAAFAECRSALDFQLGENLTGIELTNKDKVQIDKFKYQLSLHRLWSFGTPAAHFNHADELIAQSLYLEALHVIRSLPERTKNLELVHYSDYSSLLKTMQYMSVIYQKLGWLDDQISLKRMLNTLENFASLMQVSNSQQKIPAGVQKKIMQGLYDRATENKNNPESLEFLIQYAPMIGDPNVTKYKQMQNELLEKRDFQELPAAYAWYY